MSFWDVFKPKQQKMTSLELLNELLGGRESRSGEVVNWEKALKVTTVYDCCRVISDGVSQIPLRIYQDNGSGRSVANKHPLYDVINSRPNSWQTSFEFRETLMFHVLLVGNHYSFINRVGGDRRVYELIPLEPSKVQVEQNNDFSLVYKVTGNDGSQRTLNQQDIWHVRGPSWNSWMGMEAVNLARDAIGLSIATEGTHSDFFKNGVKTSGTYSVDGVLKKEQYEDLLEWITKNFNNNGPMILDRNAKWTQTQMTGVDAQHIETRNYQVEEICRAFRVMPIMVGHSDKTATYASAEQMFLAHVVHTLAPWYERLEQSININLLTEEDRRNGFYSKFTPNALMRGASKDRGEFYSRALGSGGSPAWMTPNEVRALEEMDKIEGGDTLFVPANSGESNEQSDTPA